MMKSSAQIATDAQQIIREHGWAKGVLWDTAGRVCLSGSILAAANGYPDFLHDWIELVPTLPVRNTFAAVNAVITEQFPDRSWGVPKPAGFNDHPNTTVEDVLTVLGKAAAALEEKCGSGA